GGMAVDTKIAVDEEHGASRAAGAGRLTVGRTPPLAPDDTPPALPPAGLTPPLAVIVLAGAAFFSGTPVLLCAALMLAGGAGTVLSWRAARAAAGMTDRHEREIALVRTELGGMAARLTEAETVRERLHGVSE